MLRKIALFGGTAALIGGFVVGSAQAGAPPQDTSHYTVVCDTFSKASVGFKPSLTLAGTGAPSDVATIKGTLTGCVATPDGTNPAITVISGGVKGTLTTTQANSNSCLSLLGPLPNTTGTITITWKTDLPMVSKTTVITVGSGDLTGGQLSPFGDAASFGEFSLAGTTQTGAFGGPSGTGAASFTKALTTGGVTGLAATCATTAGLKAVTLGSTEINLQ